MNYTESENENPGKPDSNDTKDKTDYTDNNSQSDTNPTDSDSHGTPEPVKKKNGCLIIILIIIGIVMIFGIGLAIFGRITYKTISTTNKTDLVSSDSNVSSDSSASSDSDHKSLKKNNTQSNKSQKEKMQESDTAKESYEVELAAGQYTAGIDIPAGTYSITVTSGSGNVSSANADSKEVNELMGTDADGYSQQTLNGVMLKDGTTLSIDGDLILQCVSPKADLQNITERTKPESETKTIDLQAGEYTAGKEFPAGTYNVIATGVSGNVSSSNLYEGGLNEIMGTDGFGITQYNNAAFKEGVTLSISGTSVQLVYVGE